MKKSLFITISAMLILTATSCHHETFDERCAREAKEYTIKLCPRQISKGFVLDSMAYYKTSEGDKIVERKFTYYYTFSGDFDNNLDKLMTEFPDTARKRLDEFKTTMLNELTTSVQLKQYKDKGFNFEYIYFSAKKKAPVLQFKFTKSDYKH